PKAQVIWAHTGMSTPAERVDALFAAHATLYGELSHRDGITTAGGALSSTWRAMFSKYPERFVLGSDTWVPQVWPEVPSIMSSHRAWLSQLPRDVAENIAWRNGTRLFLSP